MKTPRLPSQFDICRLMVASHAIFEIWVARCKAVFQEAQVRSRHICMRVISKTQLDVILASPKSPSLKYQQSVMEIMGIRYRIPRLRRGLWCKWSPPDRGWLKLNFDGSSREGCITGRGALRERRVAFYYRIHYFFWGWY